MKYELFIGTKKARKEGTGRLLIASSNWEEIEGIIRREHFPLYTIEQLTSEELCKTNFMPKQIMWLIVN